MATIGIAPKNENWSISSFAYSMEKHSNTPYIIFKIFFFHTRSFMYQQSCYKKYADMIMLELFVYGVFFACLSLSSQLIHRFGHPI